MTIREGDTFMFHDARGMPRGPYRVRFTDSTPWVCMIPEGVEVPDTHPKHPILTSGGFVGLKDLMREHGELFHRVAWASRKSLSDGPRPGLHGRPVGWEYIEMRF